MNKTKRVAWRKHRLSQKKAELKRKAQRGSTATTAATATTRR